MAANRIVTVTMSGGGGFCSGCHQPLYRGERISITNTGTHYHSRCHDFPLGPEARRDPYERRRGR